MDQEIPSLNVVLITNMDCGCGCGYAMTGILLMPYENNMLLMRIDFFSSEIEFLKRKQCEGATILLKFYTHLFCTRE